MRALSRLWTGAVAYISLLVGAGLSMAGNLADTYRTRGHDVDGLDKILAVSWPALVILAIEMFVSPRWNKSTIFQVWRWTGCLAIGSMAMLASWTHLHDLLASRGQLDTVAILGPLAIDGMAIMATGLILSTRVQDTADGQVDKIASVQPYLIGQVDKDAPVQDSTDLDNRLATGQDPGLSFGGQPDIRDALARWDQGYKQAIADQGAQLASEAEAYVHATVTTSPDLEKIPAEARDLITRMLELGAAPGEIKQAAAEMCEVSTRTAQRWLAALRQGSGNGQGDAKGGEN
jgi:hypothetical protein